MKMLSFRLWGELYGADISYVKEINRKVDFTVVPTAPPEIIGLYNMRGQVVTLFDISLMLGYQPIKQSCELTCVVLKGQPNSNDVIGFAIDKAMDVLNINNGYRLPLPANLDESKACFLEGVYQLEDELLMLVDIKKIFFSDLKI